MASIQVQQTHYVKISSLIKCLYVMFILLSAAINYYRMINYCLAIKLIHDQNLVSEFLFI